MIGKRGMIGLLLLSLGAGLATVDLHAAEVVKLEIQSNDTLKSILVRQTGKQVKLRLRNGEELGGVVAKVGDNLVQLSELTGKEFFDAAVSLDAIGAVIVRAR